MPVGQTKDVGYNIGVSRTVPYARPAVWHLLTSADGIALWLGEGAELVVGEPYRTLDGAVGEVRSFHDQDRVRITCRPAGWDHDTTVQVTVSGAAADRTTVRFHQEWLTDSAERERQRAHWKGVMDKISKALEANAQR